MPRRTTPKPPVTSIKLWLLAKPPVWIEEAVVGVESWLAPEASAKSVLKDAPIDRPPFRVSRTFTPMVVVPALEPISFESLVLSVLLVTV